MFRSERMKKAYIVCKAQDTKKVTSALYDLKQLHFSPISTLESFDVEDTQSLTKNLLTIRATIDILDDFQKNDLLLTKNADLQKISEEVANTYQQLQGVRQEKKDLEDEQTRKRVQEGLKLTKKDLEAKNATIGFVPRAKLSTIKKLTRKKFFIEGSRTYFFTRQKISFNHAQYYIPKAFLNKSLSSIEKNLVRTQEEEQKLILSLQKTAKNHLLLLRHEERHLNKELSVINAKKSFSRTKNLTVLSGFVPAKQVKALEHTLIEQLDSAYELILEDPEDAPIKFNHSPATQSFTGLLNMYSLPRYKEINPAIFIALVFPIFFGFILGDVVYGVIALAFFTLIKYKYESIAGFCTMLQLSSISSIFFGMIFGEFAGFKLKGAFYGLFMRMDRPEELLFVALIFGLVHINLGLLLSTINNAKKGFLYTLYNSISWFILELGAVAIALGLYLSITPLIYLGIALCLLTVFLIFKGHGVAGVVEMPSFFTNILSYARLMAVGLSSVTIAVLIKDFSLVLASQGILGIIVGIIFFSLAHIFNTVLGTFEGFIHPLRLHYVEFFSKFYSGGGEEYKPFGQEQKTQ